MLDPWQAARARRAFAGSWPSAKLARWRDLLARPDGEVSFAMQFAVDQLGIAHAEMEIESQPWLICQRTLEPFQLPLKLTSKVAFIEHDSQEAQLPDGYDPLVVPETPIRLLDLVEDELILALPLVPMSDREIDSEYRAPASAEKPAESAFAALAALKRGD